MAYVRGYTSSDNVLKDLAAVLTTGAYNFDPTDNLSLLYPLDVTEITDYFILNVRPLIDRTWVKREVVEVIEEMDGDLPTGYGIATLNNLVAVRGNTRVQLVDSDRRISLYLNPDTSSAFTGSPDPLSYVITGDRSSIKVDGSIIGKELSVDYEMETNDRDDYYLKLKKPEKTPDDRDNHYFIEWQTGDRLNVSEDDLDEVMSSVPVKLHYFKEDEVSAELVKGWLPIEYWISFDKNGIAGVLMGEPTLSMDHYVSTPFYFGALKQVEGALETDRRGNFAAFSGALSEPPAYDKFGDDTANGNTDIAVVTTRSGRPFYSHGAHIFGCGDYNEYVLSGISAHTGKHAVSEIVVASSNENDRGTLNRIIAVPRASKEHGAELIYKRYVGGEEERYIFIHVNTPIMPVGNGVENQIGFALRTDI